MRFLDLPPDVHSIILWQVDLKDVLRLRCTCRALSNVISFDKQLWMRIFERDVKAMSLCVPPNLRRLEDVDAIDVTSWVKHAILLDRFYANPGKDSAINHKKLSVRKIQLRPGLRVTWVKIVLGRWCLIAAADDEQSELSVWEIMVDGDVRLATKQYLQAPVTDGRVDISCERVRCALTVGTTRPYILIVGLFKSGNCVVLRQLGHLPDASHILFFRGEDIAFAARNGDDAHPYLGKWRTGQLCCLKDPNRGTIGPCLALTVRDETVFVLYRKAIHVFLLPMPRKGLKSQQVDCVCSCHLPEDPLFQGQFLESCSDSPLGLGERTVIARILLQDMTCSQSLVAVRFQKTPMSLSLTQSRVAFGSTQDVAAHRYCLGCSERVLFATSLRSLYPWRNQHLLFARVLRSIDDDETGAQFIDGNSSFFILREGLPPFHFVSSIDFDDANGLLLLGSISGDVRLASVFPEPVIPPRSVKDGLDNGDIVRYDGFNLCKQPTSLDLPIFYTIRKTFQFGSPLPPDVIQRIISGWDSRSFDSCVFPDWSNDWSRFKRIWDWVLPLSRWGPLDEDFFDDAPATAARIRLLALGEIVPVLYHISRHDRVVFRIGQKMFYLRNWPGEDDDEGREDFEAHNDGIIFGILSSTFENYSNNPASIRDEISDHVTQRNLERWTIPCGLQMMQTMAWHAYVARRDLWRSSNSKVGDDTIAALSDEDWDQLVKDRCSVN